MTSQPPPEPGSPVPDPRKKRALFIGGAIALAAIAWNADDWVGNDGPVHITVDRDDSEEAKAARDEVRNAVRETIRDEVRGAIRGEDSDNAPSETAMDDSAEGVERVGQDVASGEGRLVETESGENRRSFRIEGDDGQGITISIDGDTEN